MNDKSTLLVVDNNPNNLFVMKSVITGLLDNCEIITASNAKEGLKYAVSSPIDVALIDVQMPDMDGIEMCSKLNADVRIDFPVILITAHQTSPAFRARGLDAGATDFLSRPIDNIELLAKIKVAIRIRKNEEKLKIAQNEFRKLNSELEERAQKRTLELEITNEALQKSERQNRSIIKLAR